MRIRRREFGWLGAVVAAAAMVLAGAWYGSPSGQLVPARDDTTVVDPERLYQVLLPADGHPAGEVANLSMREATAAGWLGLPEGMRMAPELCGQYLAEALGGDDTAGVNGWVQVGPVRPEERREVFFVAWVIEVPEGVELPKVEETALRCQRGEVDLAGVISGQVHNLRAEPLDLPEAETTALRQQVTFPAPADERQAEALQRYYGPSPDGVRSTSHLEFVDLGDVLIMVSTTDPGLADRAADRMYHRALAVLG